MFHYLTLYNSVNMEIAHMSIHVMKSYSAVKKEVTKLKESHAKLLLNDERKTETLHRVITFFCKSTQNTLYFLFYT